MEEKRIYRLDDDISFRKCSLYEKNDIVFGDCTSFSTQEIKFVQYYNCNQDGVHYHCTKHPEIEFNKIYDKGFHHRNDGFLKNGFAVSKLRSAGTQRPDYSIIHVVKKT